MTLIYFSEKHKPDANPFVYYPEAQSAGVILVVRSFYQRCEGLLTSYSHSELKFIRQRVWYKSIQPLCLSR